MDFEIRCPECKHVFETEADKNFDGHIWMIVNFGDTTKCDKCGHVGIKAYAGNREENIWHEIEKEEPE